MPGSQVHCLNPPLHHLGTFIGQVHHCGKRRAVSLGLTHKLEVQIYACNQNTCEVVYPATAHNVNMCVHSFVAGFDVDPNAIAVVCAHDRCIVTCAAG